MCRGAKGCPQGLDESSPYTIPQNGEPTGLTEAGVITVQQNAAGRLRVSLSLLFFPSPKIEDPPQEGMGDQRGFK